MKVEGINLAVLKECREQMTLSIKEVQKKVKTVSEIEEGKHKPTFKQLETLSNLYCVPDWVFISDSIPKEYQFGKIPAFRQFQENRADVFSDSKVRALTTKIEQLRELILELRDDMNEAIEPFTAPDIPSNLNPSDAARKVREWLGVAQDSFDFSRWRQKLEEKEIFVFMTSKYLGWSYINKDTFRGMAIYHSSLPIIVINDSDAKQAQSFTLFHELAHLLRKESSIDDWQEPKTEKWCDEFAGNLLMPAEQIGNLGEITDLNEIERISECFKTSLYACLVRLRNLQKIDQNTYNHYENILKAKYKERKGGARRNPPKNALKQYGGMYTRALFQAYHNAEIGLHKLCQAFDLKQAPQALQLEKSLNKL